MHRTSLWLVALVLIVAFGCDKIIGRQPLVPADGPLEGNTEVSLYVGDCGDHRDVKKVLFGDVVQSIVSQKENEVKIRTTSSGTEGPVPVTLILTNNRRCETGVTFKYMKVEQSTINYLSDRSHPMGERRIGGWRPGQENTPPAEPLPTEGQPPAEQPEPPAQP